MKKFLLIILCLNLFSYGNVQLGLLQYSLGSWNVFTENSPSFGFHSARVDVYLDIYDFKANIALPVNISSFQGDYKVETTFLSFFLEHKTWEYVNLRLGSKIPISSPTMGNYEILLGTNFETVNTFNHSESGFNFKIDLWFEYVVFGKEDAFNQPGTLEFLPSAKAFYRYLNHQWGIEFLADYFRKQVPNDIEKGVFVVPHIFYEYTLSNQFDIGGKIGYGYERKKNSSSSQVNISKILNLSLYVLYYL